MTAPVALAAGAGSLVVLDAAYREAIARTSAAVIRVMLAGWSVVDVDDLAGTGEDWMTSAVAAVLGGQRNAYGLANAYTAQVRRLSVPGAPAFTPPPAEPPNVEQIRNSLEFTAIKTTAREYGKAKNFAEEQRRPAVVDPSGFSEGFVYDDKSPAAVPKQKILEDGIVRASGAAVRHVTTAGFDQIKRNVQADAAALGWYRTTKTGCCFFCAMLASRGMVYKEKSFEASNARFKGPGEQKVHDRCGCGLRPVYTMDDELPDQTEEFEQLWADSADGSGKQAILNFRRAYEGRVAPQPGR